jgi:Ca2+-binding RTX toxin-like protein
VGRLLTLLAFVTLWLPASALAADGALVNGVMTYDATGDGSEANSVVVTTGFAGEPTFVVTDQPSVNINAASPCFNGATQNVMQCPQDGNGSGAITLLSASLGDGNDTISIQTSLATSISAGGGADTMQGGPSTDNLRGGQGNDAIDGGGGNDTIIGDDPTVPGGSNPGGDDALSGGAGNDSIDGEAGNDTFTTAAGADGADTYTGGSGADTMTYSGRISSVNVTLDGNSGDGQAGENDNVGADVENVTGGQDGDALAGNDAPNSLDGGPGDDAESGGGGDDSLAGGDGNDSMLGDTGNDNENGGAGNDTMDGGTGDDSMNGGDGGDALAGADGVDNLDGGPGDDALDGGGGPDVMAGADGTDLANYGNRTAGLNVTLDGITNDGEPGEGDNVATSVENIAGGSGNDTFIGSAVSNALDGGAGEDYEDGGNGGADTLTGGAAGDVLRTRGTNQGGTVTCGPGPDFVIAKPADKVSSDCDRVDRGVNQKPKIRDSAVVAPTKGTLQMSPTGIVRRVPLQDKVVLPLRSIVDTVAGTVKVTSSATSRKSQSVTLFDSAFSIAQTAGKLPVTQFALQGGNFGLCPASQRGRGATAAASTTIRKLWANGKGKFRTRGRYASATIRGTKWQTVDRCDGTQIRVTSGAVTVTDLVKHKTVVVKAGRTYLAKAR